MRVCYVNLHQCHFLDYPVTNLSSFLINSDVLYPKDTSSPHSGVPAEVLCRGRDFVVSTKELVVSKGEHRWGLPESYGIAKLGCSTATRCFFHRNYLYFNPYGGVTSLPWESWCGLTLWLSGRFRLLVTNSMWYASLSNKRYRATVTQAPRCGAYREARTG